MLRWFVNSAFVIIVFPLLALAAPQNSSNPQSTFTSNSELVTVPVHVTDHYGRPLHGLRKDDFVLKSDGTPQRIALFHEVRTEAPASVAPAPVRAASVQGADASPNSGPKFSNLNIQAVPDQLYIVAVDILNTPVTMQGWARDQLIKYLQAKPPQQPVELVAITAGGIRRLHGFTSDNSALVSSLKTMQVSLSRHDSQEVVISKMSKSGAIDDYNSMVQELQQIQLDEAARGASAGSLTLRCFEQIAWAYAGIPGRKTVLWLTSGFPISQEVPDGPALIGHGPATERGSGVATHHELLPEFQRAFTAMNKANVVVYPIDVTGLPDDPMWDPSQPSSLFIHPELSHLHPLLTFDMAGADRDGMKEIAHRTGGGSCTAGNSLVDCIDRAWAESSDYYMLGFYVPPQQRKIGWHKLKVSVDTDHGEVRARTTYYLQPLGAAPEGQQEEDLRSAINAPVDYTGVLFSVEPGARPSGAQSPVVFKVSVPPGSLIMSPGQAELSFDVIVVPLSNKGLPISQQSRMVQLNMPPDAVKKALAKGWNLIDTVPWNDGTVAVRVVVRDNYTGRIGSLVFPVAPESSGHS